MFKLIPLFSLILLFLSATSFAQDTKKPGNDGKRKYTIHITKEVNGEKTVIDTTFEANDDFEMDAWLESHQLATDLDKLDSDMKKTQKEIRVTIPDISMEEGASPDTVIMNGDTIIINKKIENFNWFGGDPEARELEFDKQFKMPEGAFAIPHCPGMEDMPGCCPNFRFQDMPELGGLAIPELYQMFPFGRIDHMKIKKSRHGKKIVIQFDDDDEDMGFRHSHGNYYYHNSEPRQEKRVIIKKIGEPEKGEKGNTKVQRIKEGDKEIIIIKKEDKE